MLLSYGVGEDSWESLALSEIQPVNPKGNQSWIFIGRTDNEAETPIFWPPDVKSWLIWKDPDAGEDWGKEEKGMTEDEMASLTRWTCVWVKSESWWWTGRPGVLWFMESQRIGHNWATELNWTLSFTQNPAMCLVQSGHSKKKKKICWMNEYDTFSLVSSSLHLCKKIFGKGDERES